MLRFALSTFLLAVSASPQAAERITWHDDFDTARALARDRGAPLFVVVRCER